MTVRELIERLGAVSPDAIVYGCDYENGAYEVNYLTLDYPQLEGNVVLQ